MGDPLRDRQSLRALAEERQSLEISEEIGSLERLAESVERDFAAVEGAAAPDGWRQWPVRGRLLFRPAGVDEAVVTGELEASIPAVCQRCLEPFRWSLASTVDLRLVAADGTAAKDGERETWELDGATLRPVEVIDELLVMALPLSARHPDPAGCAVVEREDGHEPMSADPDRSGRNRVVEDRVGTETTRPFADLRAQMEEAKKR